MTAMHLTLLENIERILISSTSRFIAEYETDGLVITHAWPGLRSPGAGQRFDGSPVSRNAFMVSFTVPEVPRLPGIAIPNYEHFGDYVCSLLSLLYGKRFDSHGSVQSHGRFAVPHLEQYSSLCIPELPQNNHVPRADIAVPLDLRQITRIAPLLRQNNINPQLVTALAGAAKFYHQALQTAEREPEVAYLHLITAGEMLANFHHPENADLLDEEVREILDQVKIALPNGAKAAALLAAQMRQIKRRFLLTIEDLIDASFFAASPGDRGWMKLNEVNFSKRIAAAYDIRSRYVHTGISFGNWIAPRRDLQEVCLGQPAMSDKKLAKLLSLAPTYLGLERIIRYCLIRFAERHKLIVDASAENYS